MHNRGAVARQPTMTSPPFLRIGDQPISLSQAIAYLQRGDLFDSVVGEVVRQYVLDQALAQQPQLAPDDATVAKATMDFRQQQQLEGNGEFSQWLEDSGMTEAQLRSQIGAGLHLEALKAAIALPQLQQYFIERKLLLDRVVLSRIIVEEKDMIEELRYQLADGAQFESLARDYSITDDCLVNGMVGPVSRGT
ncbi:MAG: peptidylprolyl isomerase, partial [Cyanobacteria bacterium P01_A01_bin.135]